MEAIKTWADVRDLTHEERLAYIKTIPARLIFPTIEEWEREAKGELLMSVVDMYADAAAGIRAASPLPGGRDGGRG